MDNLKIIPLSEKYHFIKEKQSTIRLHEHGLMRLIPISVSEELINSTNKIVFHALLNSSVYKEMFFDHYSQKSDDKHGPFLLSSMNPEDYLEIDNNHLVEEIIQIVSSPKWSCPSISKEKLTNVKKLLNHLIDKEKDKLTTFLEFKNNLSKILKAINLGVRDFTQPLNFLNFNSNNQKINPKKWVRNDKNDNIKV